MSNVGSNRAAGFKRDAPGMQSGYNPSPKKNETPEKANQPAASTKKFKLPADLTSIIGKKEALP